MANVVVSDEAQKQFHRLPTSIRARIEKIFVRLEDWPAVSGAKPLTGNLAGHFRIRTGDYRVQFRGDAKVVVVIRIGHRDGFYE